MFHFNAERYDFWPVYEAIKQYYPLGIPHTEHGPFLHYPGLKQLEAVIVDNIHHTAHYRQRWQSFMKRLKGMVKKPIVSTTYGQEPSFSAYVELEKIKLADRIIRKELYFTLSLVGSFYSVIGQDTSRIKLPEKRWAGGTSYLTVSPEGEYKEAFELVCAQIEQQFVGYRFIPFEIATQTLEGLQVRYTDEPRNQLYYALFNQQIDLKAFAMGDPFYKYADWTRDDYRYDGEAGSDR